MIKEELELELEMWDDPDIYPVWKNERRPLTLKNLDGIHVPVMDGPSILLYPKYKRCKLLPENMIDLWTAKEYDDPKKFVHKKIDQHKATNELLKLGSDAAKFVRKFGKDIALPTQLRAISDYREKIDELSNLLGGDSLFTNEYFDWFLSCVRLEQQHIWIVDVYFGDYHSDWSRNAHKVLPVSVYKH